MQSDGRGADFGLATEIAVTSTAIVPLRIIGIVPDRSLTILRDFRFSDYPHLPFFRNFHSFETSKCL
jgi:hypothetical protein